MKKTIIATALTTLFTSATHAATVYEADGVKVDIFGDSEVVYMNPISDQSDSVIEIQDADFGFELAFDTSMGFTVGGLVEFGADAGDAILNESYVSASSEDWGKLSIGKQVSIYDDSGIGSDYQFGFTSFYEQDDGGEQVIKYAIDKDMFYGGVAYIMNTEAGDVVGTDGFDARVGARFSGVDLVVYYADIDAAGVDISNVNFEARYAFDAFSLAAAFATTDNDGSSTDSIGLAGVYQLDKAQFAAGFASIDSEAQPDLSVQYYVNASYALNSHINAYVELGGSDADDAELGYAAGMQVAF